MAPKCGICHTADSKYKCPVCELRYCSLSCYKSHRPTHAEGNKPSDKSPTQSQPKKDRPGTTQRVPKVDFNGFENDKDLLRLLERYPLLKVQLQTVYGLTLEPGPDEARTWNKRPLPDLPGYAPSNPRATRGRGGFRGGRGNRGGGTHGNRHAYEEPQSEDREHGRWTQQKGDKEAMKVISKMREGGGNWRKEDEAAEGMKEFIELLKLKFGEEVEEGG